MNVYVSNIVIAAVTFPLLALVITLPYLIYQYRKFGSVPWLRTFIVYSFCLLYTSRQFIQLLFRFQKFQIYLLHSQQCCQFLGCCSHVLPSLRDGACALPPRRA